MPCVNTKMQACMFMLNLTCHELYKVRAYLSEYDITLLRLLLLQFLLKEPATVLIFAQRVNLIYHVFQANSSKAVLFRWGRHGGMNRVVDASIHGSSRTCSSQLLLNRVLSAECRRCGSAMTDAHLAHQMSSQQRVHGVGWRRHQGGRSSSSSRGINQTRKRLVIWSCWWIVNRVAAIHQGRCGRGRGNWESCRLLIWVVVIYSSEIVKPTLIISSQISSACI